MIMPRTLLAFGKATRAENRIKFFASKGPKILYWNFTYGGLKPVFGRSALSPLWQEGVKRSGMKHGDAGSYGVSSMEAFLALTKKKNLSNPFVAAGGCLY